VIRFGDIFQLDNKDLLKVFTRPGLFNNCPRTALCGKVLAQLRLAHPCGLVVASFEAGFFTASNLLFNCGAEWLGSIACGLSLFLSVLRTILDKIVSTTLSSTSRSASNYIVKRDLTSGTPRQASAVRRAFVLMSSLGFSPEQAAHGEHPVTAQQGSPIRVRPLPTGR
jgi:hypothetical protein